MCLSAERTMRKYILLFLIFISKCEASPREQLDFKVFSIITSDVLDYKITDVNFVPNSIFLAYDKELQIFSSVDLFLTLKLIFLSMSYTKVLPIH